MAAYAAVVSLLNNIDQMMTHPRLSTSLDNKYIKPLVEKAGFLLDFIEDCFSHGGANKQVVEDLERRIASAAHAAEDVIESHVVDQIRRSNSWWRKQIISLGCSPELQQIIEDMDAIIKKAAEEKGGWSKQEKSTHTEPLIESKETSMVGLEDELLNLLDEVTLDQSSRRIISVVGMGGTGKTTLATNLYQHAYVKQHFNIRAWTTISQQYNAEGILSNLLSSIGIKSTSGSVDALGEELHKALCGRRYLIVLDDIWSVEPWDKVRRFFPVQNGSRVVLTTRLLNVATNSGSSYCLKMDLLDEDKSWKLFCDKASFPQKDDHPQLEGVGKEIVELCKGLALSIVVIGGLLLNSPRTIGYWKGVARDMKSIRDSKEKQESLDALSLSYSHLPPHLKPCFLYMGVFREDSKIRVSNIIKLWVGEGFIKPNGSGEVEEVAEGYIKDLIDRNLILVGKRRSNGKIGFCGFHDLLRDLSLKIAEKENFIHVGRYNMQGSQRRIINCSFPDPTKLPLARSIINHYGDRLVKCRLLRVFHEARWEEDKEYDESVNLRYIAYSCQYGNTLKIPSSLTLLWNLQTLIIEQGKYPSALFVMPDEFWKMRQLKHVDCGMVHLPNPPAQDEVLMLEKLQTLKGPTNLRLSEMVCNKISNTKKLHLRYHSSRHGYDESYVKFLCNLDRLHKLESLKLNLDSEVKRLKNVVRFPSSLKKLSLERCDLGWEDMTEIGLLQQLEVLNLGFLSVVKGDKWRPVEGQFLRLKFLRISLCFLIDWIADSCHFPVLEKLLLESMDKMKEIPSGIGDIPTLQLIRVDGCGEDAAVSAIQIKEDRVENDDSDDLQIEVVVNHSKFESFTERLKREELTINNIQLGRRLTNVTVETVGVI